MDPRLQARLRAVRRRWQWRRRLVLGGWLLLAGSLTALLAVYLGHTWHLARAWSPWLLLPLAPAAVAALAWPRRPLTLYQAAKLADDLLGQKDRFAAAYCFLRDGQPDPVRELAVADALGRLPLLVPAQVVPIGRRPWAVAGLALLGAAAAVVFQQVAFRPPRVYLETISEVELGAALENLREAVGDQSEFARLQAKLRELGIAETTAREEVLERLNRELASLKQRAGTEELQTQLAQLEKFKQEVAMAEVRERSAQSLANVDKLATADGTEGEAILVSLTDKQPDVAAAKRAAEALKQVATQQAGAPGTGAPPEEDLLATSGKPPAGTGEPAPGTPAGSTVVGAPAPKPTVDDLAGLALSSTELRRRILAAAAAYDRTTAEYGVVYRNYLRAFQSSQFTQELPAGRREYLERYFRAIQPPAAVRTP